MDLKVYLVNGGECAIIAESAEIVPQLFELETREVLPEGATIEEVPEDELISVHFPCPFCGDGFDDDCGTCGGERNEPKLTARQWCKDMGRGMLYDNNRA